MSQLLLIACKTAFEKILNRQIKINILARIVVATSVGAIIFLLR